LISNYREIGRGWEFRNRNNRGTICEIKWERVPFTMFSRVVDKFQKGNIIRPHLGALGIVD